MANSIKHIIRGNGMPPKIFNYPGPTWIYLETQNEVRKLVLVNCALQHVHHTELGDWELEGIEFHLCEFPQHFEMGMILNPRQTENLRKLAVKGNGPRALSHYPEFVSNLASLVELSFTEQRLQNVPDSIARLTNLRKLDLSLCQMSSFPEEVLKLTGLEDLNMMGNPLSSIPDSLVELTNLKTLDVRKCSLVQYPEIVFQMESLKYVTVYPEQRRFAFPCVKDEIWSTTQLFLSSSHLKTFPEVVTKMVALQELDLSDNQEITTLPESLVQLSSSLTKFSVSHCGLLEYPEVISKLTLLQDLNLSWNKRIKELPPSIKQLTNLEILDVVGCHLKGYPMVVFQMPSMVHVRAQMYEGNAEALSKVVSLPMAEMMSTKALDLSHGTLPFFPNVMFRLKSLEELILCGNECAKETLVDSLVSKLNKFKLKLKKLDVSEWKLSYFPESLCQLAELEELNLQHNTGMGCVPDSILQLERLRFLDVSFCGLDTFPDAVCQLKTLECLNIHGNLIKVVPDSLAQLTTLRKLNVANCGLTEFPEVTARLSSLQDLFIQNNAITKLSEPLLKYWLENDRPALDKLRPRSAALITLKEPPFPIFQAGLKECLVWYNSVRVSDIKEQLMHSVQVLGKTGSGKSSLIHTLKDGKSRLMAAANRTIVADTVEVKHEEEATAENPRKKIGYHLQVTDFGGHDIYELTCPLFLKANNITTLTAVKLPEYNEDTHDELVTKWLSTAFTHMDLLTGHICFVGTQLDLCQGTAEAESKMQLLKNKVSYWMDAEIKYISKMKQTQVDFPSFSFLSTSSKTLEGFTDLKKVLCGRAKPGTLLLPSHWNKMYKTILDEQYENKRYMKTEEVYTIFKKSLPLTRKFTSNQADFELCLQLMHDMGMVLWFGANENLKDVVFHKVSFVLDVLKCLFRHNLCQEMLYDHDRHGKFISTQIRFETEMKEFQRTGIISANLMRCILERLDLEEEAFEKLIHILRDLDLCYVDTPENGGYESETVLRFPWFVQREDTHGVVDIKWPGQLPSRTIQYSLIYKFFHKVPSTLFERFCVRIHKHFTPGGHIRYDWKHMVYVVQDGVQILLQRLAKEPEPSIRINLRCPIEDLLKLQRPLLALYSDMGNLCSELPGLVVDAYFLCPHCLLLGKSDEDSIRRIAEQIAYTCLENLYHVTCDSHNTESEKIPAAMVFPCLLDSKESEHHLKLVLDHCVNLNEKTHPSVSEELLLEVSQRITEETELHFLGSTLGVRSHTIDSMLHNHRGINDATYHVLLHWREEGIKKELNEEEMKKELKDTLCSENLSMSNVVAELEAWFG